MGPDPPRTESHDRQIEELAHLYDLLHHDVREDVSLVLGRVGTFRDDDGQSSERRIEEVLTASNHVLQVAETVAEVAGVMCGNEPIERRPVDLPRLLRAAVETARSRYAGARIELDAEAGDAGNGEGAEELEVLADAHLTAVFANLLGDAVRYSDQAVPEVVVSVETDGEAATVHVADDGPGVPEYHRAALFDAPVDGADAGTSVGRYLVGRLVDRYGGEVRVENHEGPGATVSVTLPLAS